MVSRTLLGMNIMRLNFSHGDHTEKSELIQRLRRVVQESQQRLATNSDLRAEDFADGSREDICTIAAVWCLPI